MKLRSPTTFLFAVILLALLAHAWTLRSGSKYRMSEVLRPAVLDTHTSPASA